VLAASTLASAVTGAPKNVTITSNEGVETSAARVQLVDVSAKIVPTTFSTNSDRSAITPAKTLPRGMYAIRWSVTSADGHVVTGASTFAIENRGKPGTRVSVTATGPNGKTLTPNTTDVGTKTFTLTSN
jgi:methionine-rich copper-binding protein CopC